MENNKSGIGILGIILLGLAIYLWQQNNNLRNDITRLKDCILQYSSENQGLRITIQRASDDLGRGIYGFKDAQNELQISSYRVNCP